MDDVEISDTFDYQYDELLPPKQTNGRYNPPPTRKPVTNYDSYSQPQRPTISVQISEEEYDSLTPPQQTGDTRPFGGDPRFSTSTEQLFVPSTQDTFEKQTIINPDREVEQTTVFQRGPQSPKSALTTTTIFTPDKNLGKD